MEAGSGASAWGNGKPNTFVVPPEGKRGSFLIYSNLIEEIRVTPASAAANAGR